MFIRGFYKPYGPTFELFNNFSDDLCDVLKSCCKAES